VDENRVKEVFFGTRREIESNATIPFVKPCCITSIEREAKPKVKIISAIVCTSTPLTLIPKVVAEELGVSDASFLKTIRFPCGDSIEIHNVKFKIFDEESDFFPVGISDKTDYVILGQDYFSFKKVNFFQHYTEDGSGYVSFIYYEKRRAR
jgi:hypothetical protein